MRITKSLLRRIETIEARQLPTPKAPDEQDHRFADAFLRLVERMDTGYGAIVMADVQRCPRAFDQHSTNLTMAVAHYVLQHLQYCSPLELPTEVARVYAENPDAWVTQECADCGYELPRGFHRCPLCRGPAGMRWYAFRAKHGPQIQKPGVR
jgi:hypothetical protein